MSIDALYRAVWEHPDDDAIKLVLADALMAIGDPRGELIRLQLLDNEDSGARRLLQRHGMTWLGALRGKVIPLGYEKGFLASCLVTEIEGAAGCGEWGTVHTVQLQEVAQLPLLDELRALRAVIHAEPDIFAKLLELPVARRLALIGVTEPRVLATSHTALARLPALRAAEAAHFRLWREGDGKLSRLAARWFGELPALFELMPPESIEVVTIWNVPRSAHDDLQAALMHFTGVSAELRPMSPDEDRWYEARLNRDR